MSDPIAAALSRYVEQLTPPTAPPFEEVRRRAARRWRRPAWLLSMVALLAALGTGGLVVTLAPAGHNDHRPDLTNVAPSPGPLAPPSIAASVVPSGSGGSGSAGSGSATPATPTAPPTFRGVPQHVVVAGESLHLQRQDPAHTIAAGWVDPDDPMVLDLVAGLNLPNTGGGCYAYTAAYVLDQTATAVSVSAFDYRRDGPVTGTCAAIVGAPKVHRVHLAAPLGGRSVTDQGTGVRVADPNVLLAATYLPAGYTKPGSFFDIDRPTWTYPGPGSSSLSVVLNQATGTTPTTAPSEYSRTIKQVTVRGKPGTAWTWAPNICVEWYEQGDAPFNVCGPPSGDGATSIDELVKVADGLTIDGAK